ncbi:TPA: hypothetical protein QB389_001939, partial [Pasteurella multocida]|nr:hypothetical protein [Pasteurella multocida]
MFEYLILMALSTLCLCLLIALPFSYFNKRRKARADLIFKQVSKFPIGHKHYGEKMLVAIDIELKNICLIELDKIPKGNENNSEESFKYLKAEDILKVELFEGGNSVTSSSRSLTGALVGGALFGGVGAIVGGLGGSTKSSATVNKIEIRLIINDKTNPTYDIDFLSGEINKDEQKSTYENISKEARAWYGYFEVMINRAKN